MEEKKEENISQDDISKDKGTEGEEKKENIHEASLTVKKQKIIFQLSSFLLDFWLEAFLWI